VSGPPARPTRQGRLALSTVQELPQRPLRLAAASATGSPNIYSGTAHSSDARAGISSQRGAFHDHSRLVDTRLHRRGIQTAPATRAGTARTDSAGLRATSSSIPSVLPRAEALSKMSPILLGKSSPQCRQRHDVRASAGFAVRLRFA
jgi:hypothetical protein